MAGRRREPEKMPMAALQLLAVHAYCSRRCALPSTFFGPAWPGGPVRTTGGFNPFFRFTCGAGALTERHYRDDGGIFLDEGILNDGIPIHGLFFRWSRPAARSRGRAA